MKMNEALTICQNDCHFGMRSRLFNREHSLAPETYYCFKANDYKLRQNNTLSSGEGVSSELGVNLFLRFTDWEIFPVEDEKFYTLTEAIKAYHKGKEIKLAGCATWISKDSEPCGPSFYLRQVFVEGERWQIREKRCA
jgi:hypothetical protein